MEIQGLKEISRLRGQVLLPVKGQLLKQSIQYSGN